jgi:hypothetical protein
MKFIITWDAGYGDSSEVIEADSLTEALEIAYETAIEEAENNLKYDAVEYSEEAEKELM